jgi:ACR3 family arsenite efflux pump ArsB
MSHADESPTRWDRTVEVMERYQVAIYLGAIALAVAVTLTLPEAQAHAVGNAVEPLVNPVLMLLLYATFLAVPAAQVTRALREGRFVGALLVANFVLVPALAYLLTRPIAADQPLVFGALLVLLAPCVDYVIVFTGLAGGSKERLLAATPLLTVAQIAAVPVFLRLMTGSDAVLEVGPFVEAFVLLIAVPLALAWATQWAGTRWRVAAVVQVRVLEAMVPLMAVTLWVVVASQLPAVASQIGVLARLVPIYLAFALVMMVLGWATARMADLDVPGQKAVALSGATRNSLVVLPAALATGNELVALAVVTQTLVELLVLTSAVPLLRRTT